MYGAVPSEFLAECVRCESVSVALVNWSASVLGGDSSQSGCLRAVEM